MGSRCIAEEVRSKRTKREEIIYNQNLMALGGAGIWLVCNEMGMKCNICLGVW